MKKNLKNISLKTIILMTRFIVISCVSYIGLFLSILIFLLSYSILGPIFFTTPNLEKAKDAVWTISRYKLSSSFQLKYSRADFWGNSMCYVFSYPKKYFSVFDEHHYLNQKKVYADENLQRDFRKNVPERRGCHKFVSQLNRSDIVLLKEYDYYSEYGRGAKIFINNRDNLIMFEGYLYD